MTISSLRFNFLIVLLFFMIIAILVALALSAGTSFAAQGSLPGDVLYPVKIHVNENVESLLAVTAKGDAAVEAKHALKRLTEAEELAAEGKLDAEVKAEIKDRFSNDVASMREHVKEMEDGGDFGDSAEINGDFEDELDGHYGAFMTLSGTATTTDQGIGDLIRAIKMNLDATANAHIEAEARDTEASGKVGIKTAAEGALTAAQNKIEEVKKYLEARVTASTTPEVKTNVDARIKAATDLIAAGKVSLAAEKYADAFISFKKAARAAQEAKLSLDVGVRMGDMEDTEMGDDHGMESSGSGDGMEMESGDNKSGKSDKEKSEDGASVNGGLRIKGGTDNEGEGAGAEGNVKVEMGL